MPDPVLLVADVAAAASSLPFPGPGALRGLLHDSAEQPSTAHHLQSGGGPVWRAHRNPSDEVSVDALTRSSVELFFSFSWRSRSLAGFSQTPFWFSTCWGEGGGAEINLEAWTAVLPGGAHICACLITELTI